MKLGLINSAWVQAGRGTAFGIAKTRELGFDAIDIFADPLDIDVRERRLIRQECSRAGLPIVSVACVAVGLIDFNPSVQRFHLGRVRAYLDMAYDFEASNLLLVLGEYIWQSEVIPPQEQWATAIKHVRALGEYAAELGLEIALELEPFQLSLLNDVPSMVRFLDEVDHTAVKANLDISHLVLAHQEPAAIESLRGTRCARAYLRLRRQGARRLAAGPRRRRLPAVLAGDQATGPGRRHDLGGAGILSRSRAHRRVGGRGS